ncbi:MAG: FtsQ-type POTRA domain-containing protein [Mailhella sp.]|nr:FtsQ-type POTRA domain-containing protein [Mailhella sp.]
MAVTQERRNRRVAYDASRRAAPQGKLGLKKNTRTPSDTKKKTSRRKKRKGFLPSFNITSQGVGRFIRWSLALSLVAVLMFGAAMGLVRLHRFCTTSPYFAITNIEVSGNSQVKTKDILAVCGIERGANSLAVKVHEAEQKLVKNPWIESVSIRRELPGSFSIKIKERVPVFFAKKDDILYYINDQGLLIAPVTSGNFLSLPMLELGPGGEESLHLIADFVREFRRSGFPFKLSQISWVRLSAANGFELYWEPRRMSLAVGLNRWKENLKRVASVVSDIEKRKETVLVSSIRAADGQVWMTRAPQKEGPKN